MIEKIVSAGQTGAEIAALDVAIRWDMSHGGWCPCGRKNSAGPIPACYQLVEMESEEGPVSAEWNARDSDGTVVFTRTKKATGEVLKTMRCAARHGRPCLHLLLGDRYLNHAAELLQNFIEEHEINVLHVSGCREEQEPGIHGLVTIILEEALF